MDVLGLLQSKRRCMNSYLKTTEAFLALAERGDFSSLDSFEKKRETLLRTLAMYDRKIAECARAIPPQERTPALSVSVQKNIEEEAAVIRTILSVDERVLGCMEREKLRLAQEIASAHKTKDLTGKFKSSWIPNAGAALDQKL